MGRCCNCGKNPSPEVKDKDWKGWRFAIASNLWICLECFAKYNNPRLSGMDFDAEKVNP